MFAKCKPSFFKIRDTLLSTLGSLLTPSLLRSVGFHVNILTNKCLMHFSNAGPSKFFVNASASFSEPLIQRMSITLDSLSSHRKYCCTSTCLVQPPILQLFARSTAPLLSISRIIGNFTLSPIDLMMCQTYNMS